ncbi:MAG: RagB/SusD family nutrient uptake outer membrane protein [Chitinophagaceae bacterium]|nr:RagB/SusD family nutrient uptake outer membrane protein [Chitinophagaceae bacterium]
MQKLIYILWTPFILTALVSCSKFLDVKPKGVVLPEKLNDYEALLNSPTLTETFPSQIAYCADDVQGEFSPSDRSTSSNAYYWRPQMNISMEVNPAVWGSLYHSIYDANVIINYVEAATDGTDQKKKEVLGEAMIIKADCYFSLLTIYAKSYDRDKAGTDPGLPLVNSTNVTDKTPDRSSLQATVDEVTGLLNQAAIYLPETNINRFRATKFAAFGLLARVHLYLGNNDSALIYSTKALENAPAMLDYNTLTRETNPPAELSPETLWAKMSDDYGVPGFMIYSTDLLSYFDDNDLRIPIFRRDPDPVTRIYANGNANFGLTYPEMYLTQAEIYAKTGKISEAMANVNLIRKNRIKSSAYADETASSQEDAVSKVLAERRRELAFEGLRWMDMKRLDRDNRMPAVERKNLETLEVEATLPPHGEGYVFEIPTRVLQFNKQMQKNH